MGTINRTKLHKNLTRFNNIWKTFWISLLEILNTKKLNKILTDEYNKDDKTP